MTGRGPDGPEDIDAAFAEIVAGLERDGLHARWPDQGELEALGPDAVGLFGEDDPNQPGTRRAGSTPTGTTPPGSAPAGSTPAGAIPPGPAGPAGPTGTDVPDIRPFRAFEPSDYGPDPATGPDTAARSGPPRGPDGDRRESRPTQQPGRHRAPDEGTGTSEDRADQTAEADDEHFVPPDPPPLPPMRTGTIAALALVALGILLLVAPSLLGLASSAATPLALISMSAGIGLLVLRMRQGPPPDSGWDDGAQV
ncbi:hypothetical protein [Goodfellowiella coeruleoviolacea]|uniref:DUF308 domain-containing protein n=1 Tax=Goodfellowiella coeruleoviolacea TaxID=334858 RepID=A0AAE3GDE6_9PSEU|nr:hypothetical protein [Goodfellowiella coeruleoviolacea]MCP2165324.1 hypothetical protein [Goodfellowiella coeruleoviolacea]